MNCPKTNAIIKRLPMDDFKSLVPELVDHMSAMEDLLRFLRDRANNYVPTDKLAEIDKFLKP
jgi:hypothetical protein